MREVQARRGRAVGDGGVYRHAAGRCCAGLAAVRGPHHGCRSGRSARFGRGFIRRDGEGRSEPVHRDRERPDHGLRGKRRAQQGRGHLQADDRQRAATAHARVQLADQLGGQGHEAGQRDFVRQGHDVVRHGAGQLHLHGDPERLPAQQAERAGTRGLPRHAQQERPHRRRSRPAPPEDMLLGVAAALGRGGHRRPAQLVPVGRHQQEPRESRAHLGALTARSGRRTGQQRRGGAVEFARLPDLPGRVERGRQAVAPGPQHGPHVPQGASICCSRPFLLLGYPRCADAPDPRRHAAQPGPEDPDVAVHRGPGQDRHRRHIPRPGPLLHGRCHRERSVAGHHRRRRRALRPEGVPAGRGRGLRPAALAGVPAPGHRDEALPEARHPVHRRALRQKEGLPAVFPGRGRGRAIPQGAG